MFGCGFVSLSCNHPDNEFRGIVLGDWLSYIRRHLANIDCNDILQYLGSLFTVQVVSSLVGTGTEHLLGQVSKRCNMQAVLWFGAKIKRRKIPS